MQGAVNGLHVEIVTEGLQRGARLFRSPPSDALQTTRPLGDRLTVGPQTLTLVV